MHVGAQSSFDMILNTWLKLLRFRGSRSYWEKRYRKGGTSGSGSAGQLASFKAGFLNDFVASHDVRGVIEFGCGDGQQLTLAHYPRYTGLDVSATAIALCRARHGARENFRFFVASDRAAYAGRYELALSLDVIFHLVEDAVYDLYMRDLFAAASRFVIVYSSNFEAKQASPHVRHRKFTDWIAKHAREWTLLHHMPNPHPHDSQRPDETSFCDFYVYARQVVS